MESSVLEDIPGIGAKRRAALMKHFKSIKAVSVASVDELEKVPGISRSAAEEIYAHFRKNDNKVSKENEGV